MADREFDVVTGAFGYSGKHIARRLIEHGRKVRTLTGRPNRPNPFGEALEVHPFNFDDPDALTESLRGAGTLFNTYWIRFHMKKMTYEQAVVNTGVLIKCAVDAGVKRLVHISIVRPSADSPFPYYRGKAAIEEMIHDSGISHAILRPTLFFGGDDILVNNITWALRHFPLFMVCGRGDYGIQPIYIEDLVDLALEHAEGTENVTLDAVGPETFTYEEFVRMIAERTVMGAWLVHVPRRVMLLASWLIGFFMRDVMLTPDELDGLMSGLMASDEEPTGTTRVTDWVSRNSELLGRVYASEMGRR